MEHSICPAEIFLSKSALGIEFRLCPGNLAECDKTCSDRISVWWAARVLSGGSVSTFCSKAEHFSWLAEMALSKFEVCIGFRLCSAEPAEIGKN